MIVIALLSDSGYFIFYHALYYPSSYTVWSTHTSAPACVSDLQQCVCVLERTAIFSWFVFGDIWIYRCFVFSKIDMAFFFFTSSFIFKIAFYTLRNFKSRICILFYSNDNKTEHGGARTLTLIHFDDAHELNFLFLIFFRYTMTNTLRESFNYYYNNNNYYYYFVPLLRGAGVT